jgi:hypothetical protein
MKKIRIFLQMIFLIFNCGIIFSTDLEIEIFNDTTVVRNISVKQLPSKEYLKFKIQWEFVPAGESIMTCNEEIINNRRVYHITTNTYSNSSIDVVYKVRNQTDSYVDYYGIYSLKFTNNQDEGGRSSKEYILFDNKNCLWYSILDGKSGTIPKYVQDIVSSLYYLRTQDLEVGKKYSIDVYTGKMSYPMIVSVLKKEDVKVSNEKFRCIKVEPKVDEEKFSLFRIKGKLYVWLTDDERRLPVKMQTKIFIGSVYAILDEYSYN